ncbi:MAG: DEAD/DEAH box helicase, partial [Saprospiraceae bacterium]
METYHPVLAFSTYADIILPLAVPKPYTYAVPEELVPLAQTGVRAEVQFGGGKRYSGLVLKVHHDPPPHPVKPLLSIIDDEPLLNEPALKFWLWLASYYCCSLGEVMDAALPANLKLASERRLVLSPFYDGNLSGLDDREFLITEALSIQETITVDDVQKILNIKPVLPFINRLLEKKVIYLFEEMQDKFKPKKVASVRLAEPYRSAPKLLEEAFELCATAARQTETLISFVQLAKEQGVATSGMEGIRRQDIYKKAGADASVLKAMERKGIFELFEREVSRLGGYEEELTEASDLSKQQVRTLDEIKVVFKEKNVVLLHGVTGSGKTRVYVELIREAIARGEQVLYLLPEVALTTQIISRLQKIFGSEISVYHHRITHNERVELWKSVRISGHRAGKKNSSACILGARSALFLPYANLGLVIVDEEHDTSYKQHDPAPRYNGRDAAIYLAHLHGA